MDFVLKVGLNTHYFFFLKSFATKTAFIACPGQPTFYKSVGLSLEAQFIRTQNTSRLDTQLSLIYMCIYISLWREKELLTKLLKVGMHREQPKKEQKSYLLWCECFLPLSSVHKFGCVEHPRGTEVVCLLLRALPAECLAPKGKVQEVGNYARNVSAGRFLGFKEQAHNSFHVSFYSVYFYKHPSSCKCEKHQLSELFLSSATKF